MASSSTSQENSASPPASPELQELLATAEAKFSKTGRGADLWYLVAAAGLAGAGEPLAIGALYRHLIAQQKSSEARKQILRRIRETLIKGVALYGICKPLEAIMSLDGAIERDEDRDPTFTREGWQADGANRERANAWLERVYTHNKDATLALFNDHPDFIWLARDITYGLYLSDRQVLDDVETAMVTVTSIMVQNLPRESWWHLRGIRRVGASLEESKVVYEIAKMITKYAGGKMDRVPHPDDVEKDV